MTSLGVKSVGNLGGGGWELKMHALMLLVKWSQLVIWLGGQYTLMQMYHISQFPQMLTNGLYRKQSIFLSIQWFVLVCNGIAKSLSRIH